MTTNTIKPNVFVLLDAIKIMHGAVTAIIFFNSSAEARQRWANFLCPFRFKKVTEDEYEMDSDHVNVRTLEQSLISRADSCRASEMVGVSEWSVSG